MFELPADLRMVLASGSPRRSELLRGLGLDFEIRSADIDESVRAGERAEDYVTRLSAEKAAAVVQTDELVIAADTTVEVGGDILAKPIDARDARRMLGRLSGTTHLVHTGVTVMTTSGARSRIVTTAVTFVELADEQIDWYVNTGEPFDKAGGYAMQGVGGVLVERIDGSVSNVIGLPLAETVDLLRMVLRDR